MTDQTAERDTESGSPGRGERILVEAARLFAVHGYAGTRMTDVAAAIGVTKPIIYRHFTSKEALFEAMVERDLGPRTRVAAAALQMHAGDAAALAALVLDTGLVAIRDARVVSPWGIAIGEAGRFPELARYLQTAFMSPVIAALEGAVGRLQASGGLDASVPPQMLARLLIAPLIAEAATALQNPADGPTPEDLGALVAAHRAGWLAAWARG